MLRVRIFLVLFTVTVFSLFSSKVVWAQTPTPVENAWPMAGANPERSGWSPEEVPGILEPVWYNKFTAYIPGKIQVIAANDKLYISASDGLHALDAATGTETWFYPTSMPLGHSPTYSNGVLYVGGLDKKIHAVDANSGTKIWEFTAEGGFEVNPLVADSKIFAGSRDGYFYVLDEANGNLIWKYKAPDMILHSAAYKDYGAGEKVVYFGSNDGTAYAFNVNQGATPAPIWSKNPPVAGFNSYWPVVYQDKVIFVGATPYGTAAEFGTHYPISQIVHLGNGIYDATSVYNFYFDNPNRKLYFVLERTTGDEALNIAPIIPTTDNGISNPPPPIAAPDGYLYQKAGISLTDNSVLQGIPWADIVAWKPTNPPNYELRAIKFQTAPQVSETREALDEIFAQSGGGNLIYYLRIDHRQAGAAPLIGLPYSQAPMGYFGYPPNDFLSRSRPLVDTLDKLWKFPYGHHGSSQGPVPYKGKLYMIVYNTVVALSASGNWPSSGSSDPGYTPAVVNINNPTPKTVGLLSHITGSGTSWPSLIEQKRYSYYGAVEHYELFKFSASTTGSATDWAVAAQIDANTTLNTINGPSSTVTNVWSSKKTPATLFETNSNTVKLEAPFKSMAYVNQTTGAVTTINGSGTITGNDMKEGWILVWFGQEAYPGIVNWGDARSPWNPVVPDWTPSPVLISLQKKPDSVSLSSTGIQMNFSSSAGFITAVSLYGLHNTDPNLLTAWQTQVPQAAVDIARVLNQVNKEFPITAVENWSVSPINDTVSVVTNYTFQSINDDWSTPHLKLAFLPHEVALASWNNPQINVSGIVRDLDYVIPMGRMIGVENVNSSVATISTLASYWRNTLPVPSAPATDDPLYQKLAGEVSKIVAAGHLRPGYRSSALWAGLPSNVWQADMLGIYWANPSDLHYTLIRTLPLLQEPLKSQLKTYLQDEYNAGYQPHSWSYIGFSGVPREFYNVVNTLPIQIETQDYQPNKAATNYIYNPVTGGTGFMDWTFPPFNFYALSLYAKEFGDTQNILNITANKLQTPRYSISMPYVLNSYLAGYLGYYKLLKLNGAPATQTDPIELELAKMFVTRTALMKNAKSNEASGFIQGGREFMVSKYQPDLGVVNYKFIAWGFRGREFNPILGNLNYDTVNEFMFMVPEVAKFLSDYAKQDAQEYITSYTTRAPYWFVNNFEDFGDEGSIQPLYEPVTLFQAKAKVLNESRSELEKYLDGPMFVVGDLFYIENLMATLESGGSYVPTIAQTPIPTVTPTPVLTTSTFFTTIGDGRMAYFGPAGSGCSQTEWDNAYNSLTGSPDYTSSIRSNLASSGCQGNTAVSLTRGFLPFDTSSLPDNAVITSAKLYLYVTGSINSTNDGKDYIAVVQSTQADPLLLTNSDFAAVGNTAGSQNVDIGSISLNNYNSWTLNSTGLGWVSTIGNTLLGLREGHDIENTWGNYTVAQGNGINVAMNEQTGTNQDPYLEVSYYVPQSVCNKKVNGDANCDDIINLNDFISWKNEFLNPTGSPTADFNNDGSVNLTDFIAWKNGFLNP